VLDIDGPEFNSLLIKAAREIYFSMKNHLGVLPLYKASGSKGMHIICKIDFPVDMKEPECLKYLTDLGYTIWNLSNAKYRDLITFGKKEFLNREKNPNAVCYIDKSMFTRRRMVRSFCLHHRSGLYSVPCLYTDTYNSVLQRLKSLDCLINFTLFSTVAYSKEKLLYTLTDYTPTAIDILSELPYFSNTIEKSTTLHTTSIYKRMPQIIKQIVQTAHISHEIKWTVVIYLHIFELLDAKEIAEWLWKYSSWMDLTNTKETMYHCSWSSHWAERELVKNLSNPKKDRPSYQIPLSVDVMKEIYNNYKEKYGSHYSVQRYLRRKIERFVKKYKLV